MESYVSFCNKFEELRKHKTIWLNREITYCWIYSIHSLRTSDQLKLLEHNTSKLSQYIFSTRKQLNFKLIWHSID